MKQKKLNLIPVTQLTSMAFRDSDHYASYDPKYGKLIISSSYVRDSDLNNKFIKVFADGPNKVLAWSKVENQNLLSKKDGKLKQLKMQGGSWLVTLPKQTLLEAFRLKETDKVMKRSPIKEYVDIILGKVSYIEVRKVDLQG